MGWLKRWRTTRGYGVHSTFAYNLITKVIGQTSAHYYAYAEIDSLCPKGRRTGLTDNFSGFHYAIPDARLLFRLLCRFNPAQVIDVGNGHEVTNTILERAVPRARRECWVDSRVIPVVPCGLVFVLVNIVGDESAAAVEVMIHSLSQRPEGVVVVARNIGAHQSTGRMWRRLIASAPGGMDFSNGHIGILCALPGLPRQSYTLNF